MNEAVFLAVPAVDGAACAGHPEPLWDADVYGETTAERTVRHTQAKAICDACPVLLRCLDAYRALGGEGVWAGVVHMPQDKPKPKPKPPRQSTCDECEAPLSRQQLRFCSNHCRTRGQMQRRRREWDDADMQAVADALAGRIAPSRLGPGERVAYVSHHVARGHSDLDIARRLNASDGNIVRRIRRQHGLDREGAE